VKVMFLDESGDHGLGVIDPDYPVFVLGGIIVDLHYAHTVMDREVRRFKRDLLGDESIILHTADICRNRNGFERLKEPAFRQRFFLGVNELMQRLDYKVVACAIMKESYTAHHGATAEDPYEHCLTVLVERFCYEIGGYGDGGWVVAESRGQPLDAALLTTWEATQRDGTPRVSIDTVNRRIRGLVHRRKSRNIAGLQIADLVVSPIGRHVIGKAPHDDFRIVESKFRRGDDDYRGSGLVILPQDNEKPRPATQSSVRG
jgi:hypothetical protein